MVLSNAERQQRYRERLKDRAQRGVTPEDVLLAMRASWESSVRDDPSLPSWDDYLAACTKAKKKGDWLRGCIDLGYLEPGDDLGEYGDAADTVRRVAAVMRVVLKGPESLD